MRGEGSQRRLGVVTAMLLLGSTAVVLRSYLHWELINIEGEVRPSLMVRTLAGTSVQLPVPYARRHILVLFLVTCPHCQRELEHLRRLAPDMGSCDIFTLSLSNATETQAWAHEARAGSRVLLMDPEEAFSQLGIRRVPALLLTNAEGRVEHELIGARDFAEDSVMMLRYCQEGTWERSAVDPRGEDPLLTGSRDSFGGPHKRVQETPVSVR